MRKNELLLASRLLDEMRELVGNRCCNDYDIPKDLFTFEEVVAMKKDMRVYNGDPEMYDPNIDDNYYTQDYFIAGYMSHLLKKLADSMP